MERINKSGEVEASLLPLLPTCTSLLSVNSGKRFNAEGELERERFYAKRKPEEK
jgi:hypothetical protein